MSTVPVPRWAVSFADLFLLLLGCFVLLHAMEASRGNPATGAARAAGGYSAADLFQPGEAVLKPDARAQLQAEGRRLAGHAVRIVSAGTAEAGGRLDRFELSAARAAAVGRALQEGGVRDRDVAIAMAESANAASSQRIAVSLR
jgi:outer membrane protein OmpA-like peptidoglycan-associated protein